MCSQFGITMPMERPKHFKHLLIGEIMRLAEEHTKKVSFCMVAEEGMPVPACRDGGTSEASGKAEEGMPVPACRDGGTPDADGNPVNAHITINIQPLNNKPTFPIQVKLSHLVSNLKSVIAYGCTNES